MNKIRNRTVGVALALSLAFGGAVVTTVVAAEPAAAAGRGFKGPIQKPPSFWQCLLYPNPGLCT